jgi:hypothetical protein
MDDNVRKEHYIKFYCFSVIYSKDPVFYRPFFVLSRLHRVTIFVTRQSRYFESNNVIDMENSNYLLKDITIRSLHQR